ncbi:hypothetical protein MFLO_10433 [Listeria floridensis FSL S10-1187]|uniref:Uncharacterized protein n=1 Tax=Listeria floridensis FSL S10-1187 TaxID=1265817 RepID=A0ABN0RE02_9LIST|nr:hypothetical protein [Listeria floridensis]EUJ30546.1 hypothetical protein MFLO_10433 [Listeria floridensis FSL S10-1187]
MKLTEANSVNLFGLPAGLSSKAGLLLSIVMLVAGCLIILAKNNDFLLFLALMLWIFGLVLGLLFSPSFSGIYFRPISCFLCLVIGLYIFTDYNRKK